MAQSPDSTRISVIIPAYNQATYLGQAIQSVLNQTYSDFEIIVVDDGSTDHTRDVVGNFSDPRITYIYQENQGLSAARNTAMRHSAGAYLSFLDSDDLFLPQKLQLLLDELRKHTQLGLVAGQAIPIDESGSRIGTIFDREIPSQGVELLLGNPLHVGSVLLRRTWQEKVGFFDEQLRSYEDWDMWLRLAQAGCPMGWVARPVSLYRFHKEQMTRDGTQMTKASFAVLDKLFRDPALPPGWRAQRDRAYSRAYLRAAAQAYRVADVEAGKQHLTRATTLEPELLAEGGKRLCRHLAAWAELPKISEPLSFLERIYENLPANLSSLRERQASELCQTALRLAFLAYERGELATARRYIRRAVAERPAQLANRGVLSVFVKSHVPLLRSLSPNR